ncbi:hypothetical protein [Amycolatopsis jiangsuensis]|uniref:Lipoprotein n=1 Tax=Amycolatopsis jiangsuensis TaxID=1181879 RepID=A0A840J1M9_9PSEU|nr:hypothetical protein [Amycolatopsis jiangsuensis]MBB4687114.1 hypothetical protein [Amycolatopsis jiangsuensis]
MGMIRGSVVLGAAVLAAGCAASAGGARDAGPVLIERAEGTLVAECMTKQGFRYWPPAPATADERREFPYVVDDPAWARAHGYGGDLVAQREHRRAEDPNTRYLDSLSEERRAAAAVALGGTGSSSVEAVVPGGATIGQSDTGCLAEAQRTLYGDFDAWVRASVVTGNLSSLYQPKVTSDPRFRRAVTAWSGCMHSAGLPYASPQQIQRQLPELTDGQNPAQAHRTEVELAVAEAGCALATPLSKVARDLDRQYGDEVRRQYRSEVETTERLRRDALNRAEELLARNS